MAEGVFEIREYEDETDDKKAEIIDLEQQYKGMRSALQQGGGSLFEPNEDPDVNTNDLKHNNTQLKLLFYMYD